MLRANIHTGRFQADVNPVGAVVALGSGVGVGVNVKGVVRASLHARLAADAAVFVEVHDAVGPEI